MKLAVLGATGMVGTRLVSEALARGHAVIAASRSGRDVHGVAGTQLEIGDTAALAALPVDVLIISVPAKRGGMTGDDLVTAHTALLAARPSYRIVSVSGMGALETSPGVRVMDAPDYPQAWRTESGTNARLVDLYRSDASTGVDWTLLSPPWLIEPGERSASYRVGDDAPIGERISAETFAVALLDEVERPAHRGVRFTVAD